MLSFCPQAFPSIQVLPDDKRRESTYVNMREEGSWAPGGYLPDIKILGLKIPYIFLKPLDTKYMFSLSSKLSGDIFPLTLKEH